MVKSLNHRELVDYLLGSGPTSKSAWEELNKRRHAAVWKPADEAKLQAALRAAAANQTQDVSAAVRTGDLSIVAQASVIEPTTLPSVIEVSTASPATSIDVLVGNGGTSDVFAIAVKATKEWFIEQFHDVWTAYTRDPDAYQVAILQNNRILFNELWYRSHRSPAKDLTELEFFMAGAEAYADFVRNETVAINASAEDTQRLIESGDTTLGFAITAPPAAVAAIVANDDKIRSTLGPIAYRAHMLNKYTGRAPDDIARLSRLDLAETLALLELAAENK